MSDWTGQEADTIATELARVVLGGRGPERTEQRMDAVGSLCRMLIAQRYFAVELGQRLLPAIQRATAAFQAFGDRLVEGGRR